MYNDVNKILNRDAKFWSSCLRFRPDLNRHGPTILQIEMAYIFGETDSQTIATTAVKSCMRMFYLAISSELRNAVGLDKPPAGQSENFVGTT